MKLNDLQHETAHDRARRVLFRESDMEHGAFVAELRRWHDASEPTDEYSVSTLLLHTAQLYLALERKCGFSANRAVQISVTPVSASYSEPDEVLNYACLILDNLPAISAPFCAQLVRHLSNISNQYGISNTMLSALISWLRAFDCITSDVNRLTAHAAAYYIFKEGCAKC